jgi:hypothetical protein
MCRTREENAEDLRMETEPSIQGVCKDCGNGTLNNELNHAFDTYDDCGNVQCARCGSSHVDVIIF